MNSEFRVIECRRLTSNIFSLVFDAGKNMGEIAGAVRPGQFVHILCGEGNLLRRPISVCDTDGSLVRIVFAAVGAGTEWLSRRQAGDVIDALGPLGNGFPDVADGSDIVLLGGGIGAAPLLLAAARYGKRCRALLGFTTAASAILVPEFTQNCAAVTVFTDDGTLGRRGYAVDELENTLGGLNKTVFVCGPKPMLAAVPKLPNIYVSLEERMACGIGTCLGCAAETKDGYKRVCKDGPVFSVDSLQWTVDS